MFCPHCGAENEAENKFCMSCGKPIPERGQVDETTGDATDETKGATPSAGEDAPASEEADEKPGGPTARDGSGETAAASPTNAGVGASPADGAKPAWYASTGAKVALGVCGGLLVVGGIAGIVAVTSKPSQPSQPAVTESQGQSTEQPGKEDSTEGGDEGHDTIITDGNDVIVAGPDDVVITTGTVPTHAGTGSTDKPKESAKKDYGKGKKFEKWDDECLDADGLPTAYAISELEGWQLETLCQKSGLTWNRDQWENEDYALVVYDANHKRISDDEIAKLGKGASESGVVYEIQSKTHHEPKDAYSAFVGKYLSSEDYEQLLETSGLGVAYGPSMTRLLVPVYQGSVVDYTIIQVVPEGSIKDGSYDTFDDAEGTFGKSYGRSVPQVFETKARRSLGSSH